MTTDFLKQVVLEAISKNQKSLIRDLLQARKDEFVFKAYEHKGCFFKIDSLEAYYKANLALLDTKTRNNVFNSEAPIYTKVGDNAPVKYGLESSVKNSLVADGCMIEGHSRKLCSVPWREDCQGCCCPQLRTDAGY